MFFVIRKRQLLLAGICFLCGLGVLMSTLKNAGTQSQTVEVFVEGETVPPVFVVDPGHGGEDGGAVAADGTIESGLNLEIALRVNDILQFCGQKTIMTRTDDISIYSDNAETLRQKKASDLKNRVALVNGTPNAILLSIHQNMLPNSPATHGAQVFYNRQEGSAELAAVLQSVLNLSINPNNEKTEKQISDSIYLMKNVTAPAVLVECGFLSNEEETAKLQDDGYQTQLAAAITAGILMGICH